MKKLILFFCYIITTSLYAVPAGINTVDIGAIEQLQQQIKQAKEYIKAVKGNLKYIKQIQQDIKEIEQDIKDIRHFSKLPATTILDKYSGVNIQNVILEIANMKDKALEDIQKSEYTIKRSEGLIDFTNKLKDTADLQNIIAVETAKIQIQKQKIDIATQLNEDIVKVNHMKKVNDEVCEASKISGNPDLIAQYCNSNTQIAVNKNSSNTSKKSNNTKQGNNTNKVVYNAPDGSKSTKIGGSISWRNNNPGNVRCGDYAKRKGAIGCNGGFAVFPDKDTGDKAREDLIFKGDRYRNLKLNQIIKAGYAPPKENNVKTYNEALRRTGVDMNKKMKDMNTDARQKILDAMQKHEGWKEGKIEYQRKDKENDKKNTGNIV